MTVDAATLSPSEKELFNQIRAQPLLVAAKGGVAGAGAGAGAGVGAGAGAGGGKGYITATSPTSLDGINFSTPLSSPMIPQVMLAVVLALAGALSAHDAGYGKSPPFSLDRFPGAPRLLARIEAAMKVKPRAFTFTSMSALAARFPSVSRKLRQTIIKARQTPPGHVSERDHTSFEKKGQLARKRAREEGSDDDSDVV